MQPVSGLASKISGLTREVKLLRLSMYVLMIFLIILSILVILALTYADSYDPLMLFSASERIFSFSGNPISAMVVSNASNYLWCDMIDNGSVFLYGRSLIVATAAGPIVLTPATGESRTVRGPLTIIGDAGEADITTALAVNGQPQYNNTHLYFSAANVLFEHRGPNYNVILSAGPGDIKAYDDEMIAVDGGRPLYLFDQYLRLSGGNFTIEGPEGTFPFEGTIAYAGTVQAYTPDTMWTYLPVNETENLFAAKEIKVANTDGSLVIGGKEYWCRGADNMDIVGTTDNSTAFMIKLGMAQAVGKVSSLTFRGQEYASQPIKNFMRDGYFTLATGMLTALLALFSRKLVEEYRRK